MPTILRLMAMHTIFSLAALAGCGIITAPLSIPLVNSENVPVDARGTIVDQDGQPLQNVRILVSEDQSVWDPLLAESQTTRENTITADNSFNIPGKVGPYANSLMDLTFQKDGYYSTVIALSRTAIWREYSAVPDYSLPNDIYEYPYHRSSGTGSTSMNARNIPNLIILMDTDPRDLGPARIVMQKHGPFTSLTRSTATLMIQNNGRGVIARWQDGWLMEEDAVPPAAPGVIYIDAVRDDAGHFISDPVPGYDDRATPPRLKLAISGPGNGFIRRTLASLPTIERQLKSAPSDDYADAVFPQGELERLLLLEGNRSWFFVRINGLYGRGCIEALKVTKPDHNASRYDAASISLRITLWMQPDGSRNLETAP